MSPSGTYFMIYMHFGRVHKILEISLRPHTSINRVTVTPVGTISALGVGRGKVRDLTDRPASV